MRRVVAAAAAVLVLAGLAGCAQDSSAGPCTVTEKDRTVDADGRSQARVYTEECGVFVVDDAPLKGQFNSADTFAGIDVGSTYEFETYGFRNGFLSSFPNIITATEVTP